MSMQNILETQVSDLSSLVDSPIIPLPIAGHSPFAMPNAPMRTPPMHGHQSHGSQNSIHTQPPQHGQAQISIGTQGRTGVRGGGAQDRNRQDDSTERSIRGDTKERDGVGGNSGKRKSTGDGEETRGGGSQNGGQPRAKRNRYISIAWYVLHSHLSYFAQEL